MKEINLNDTKFSSRAYTGVLPMVLNDRGYYVLNHDLLLENQQLYGRISLTPYNVPAINGFPEYERTIGFLHGYTGDDPYLITFFDFELQTPIIFRSLGIVDYYPVYFDGLILTRPSAYRDLDATDLIDQQNILNAMHPDGIPEDYTPYKQYTVRDGNGNDGQPSSGGGRTGTPTQGGSGGSTTS
ncbi:hypothetical protein [Tenacibaculum jejuense]|uniref:Uncharacterized protein n=1 Tax=Tenacibaculum jejuense TaxID=584609 RepID=A0A238U9Z2_9FLAO|nr:hypothetical protein [Tenacibaculum jejuense]SNR15806.1 protein of unknown function [Tenacibaculum jejuense]